MPQVTINLSSEAEAKARAGAVEARVELEDFVEQLVENALVQSTALG
jgi:hypothetical protein